MKRLSVAIALILLFVALGNAQESTGLEVLLSTGVAIPSSPAAFADYWKVEYGGSVGVGWALSPSVTLIGSVEFYRFQLDKSGVSDAFDTEYMQSIWIVDDVSMNPSADPTSALTVVASVRVAPSAVSGFVSPYVLAGGGVMRFDFKEIDLPTTSSLPLNGATITMTAEQRIMGGTETAVFIHGGLGLFLDVSDVIKPFVEVRGVFGFTEGATTVYIPVTVGVKIGL